MVEIARNRFGFAGRVTIADGRTFLTKTSQRYDLIFLDVCTADRLAYHLFTVEALRALGDRLSPDGIAVIEFIGNDGPWSASLLRTVEAVFGRSLVLAARQEVRPVGPRWIFAASAHPLDLAQDSRFPPAGLRCRVIRPSEPGCLLTDDRFPAELDWARTALISHMCRFP